MDLVATVHKQGSRGGVNFSWDEVANSNRREHYLGHSIKAPVGRWQQGRDLTWYAKDGEGGEGESGDNGNGEDTAAAARRDELRRVKEAEEEAMALALGLPPGTRLGGGPAGGSSALTGGSGTGANSIAVPAGSDETEVTETTTIAMTGMADMTEVNAVIGTDDTTTGTTNTMYVTGMNTIVVQGGEADHPASQSESESESESHETS
ncbi:hypothetical protein Sste5346_004581 [Sporothrix stenoceras]|uniref:Multiple myeloma tumor-associated protein 2-like N-terminal domain-containing protein n=1 Tax=Sporothrix stenoceras TaxID=5173 RepID=A0ABR3Z8R1_9PEZI